MAKKIKICHIVDSLNTGGMENGVINILNKIDRNKFEPSVICVKAEGSMSSRLADDVQIINLQAPDGKQPLRFLKLGKIFKQNKFSIIHTHGWGACSFDGILAAKWSRTPFVINGEHGTFFLGSKQLFLQKIIYRLCNAILSVSDSLKDEVTQNIGLPPKSITTIANGVDCDIFTGQHSTEKLINELSSLHYSPSQTVIGNIGSLKDVKNQSLLIKAIALVKKQRPEIDLAVLLIGTGPDQAMLENLASELGIRDNIHFLGLRKDIPELLSLIDVLVSTSKSEGMSNVTLESFASEVPIVTTNSPGMCEIVQEGITGFILDEPSVESLYLRLLDICSNPKVQLKQMGKASREFVLKNHSINKMVSDYESFYLSL